MEHETKKLILDWSGFKEDVLPFKYLGVSISSKRLNVEECNRLAERMIQRIRIWGRRTMSYSARVLLVNSVLLSIHSYRDSIFILPKAVLDQVNAICKNFIWDGRPVYSRAPPIAWDLVCRPKKALVWVSQIAT